VLSEAIAPHVRRHVETGNARRAEKMFLQDFGRHDASAMLLTSFQYTSPSVGVPTNFSAQAHAENV
jgi:hypothetical protein